MKILGLAALSVCLSTAAVAQQPMGFKDLILGAPLSNGAVSKKVRCKGQESVCYYFKSVSSARETIAGAEIDSISVSRRGGKIQDIHVSFSSDHFEQVKEAIVDKYPGLRCERSSVLNRVGARFDQVECNYTAPSGDLVVLSKRAQTVGKSQVIFTTHAEVQEIIRKQAGAKKDL